MEPHNSTFAKIAGWALCPTMGAMPHLTLVVNGAPLPNNRNLVYLGVTLQARIQLLTKGAATRYDSPARSLPIALYMGQS